MQSSRSALSLELIADEYPAGNSIYLNYGSCGKKPCSVLRALQTGWQRLNQNPTIMTFLDEQPWEIARSAAADLFYVPAQQLVLTNSTTHSLQLVMQSFLRQPGDELITTDHEHGSVNVIARYLEDSRGITVRRHKVDPGAGSEALCLGLLGHVTKRTKLVVVSEIFSYTGWRPDLGQVLDALDLLEVPALLDGAHAPGQYPIAIREYQMWAASGHKWLCGPNATGFLFVAPKMASRLEPLILGDKYYERKESNSEDLRRLEAQGTADVVRWIGLAEACNVQQKFGPELIAQRQLRLRRYLEAALKPLKPIFRLPESIPESERSAAVAFYWPSERVLVPDLREALWLKHKVWVQPDFIGAFPGNGIRVSCHYSVSESDLDTLVSALQSMVS